MQLVVLFCFFALALADYKRAHFWVAGNPDALVSVNVDWQSSGFGQITHTTPVPAGPTRKTTGNSAHHIGQSGNWIVAGGLLSFFVHVPSACGGPLSGGDANGGNKDDTFVFSVNGYGVPSFHSSYNLPGGCTDEFHATSVGGATFIVSQMCDDVGNSPGGLIKFTLPSCSTVSAAGVPLCYASFSNWGFKSSGVAFAGSDGFNPHGGDFDSSFSNFVISDFVWPASLLNLNTRNYLATYCGDNVSPPLTFRNTVRLFNAATGIQTRSYTLPGAGYIATKFVSNGWAISAGTVPSFLGGDPNLYLINTGCTQTATNTCRSLAYDFKANFGDAFSVGLPYVDLQHKRILIAYGMRWVVLLQYTTSTIGIPQVPFTKVWSVDLGVIPGATDDQYPFPNTQGSHYVRVNGDLWSAGSFFVVINSFVDFPVNNVNGGLQYECTGSPGTGPLGTAWPDCPPAVDGGVATFFCNFHGARTANYYWFGTNGGSPQSNTDFNPTFAPGGSPHSVVFTS